MLNLFVDTSTWLDLAARRDGQKWIVTLRQFIRQGDLRLLVPAVVIEEFERNRPRAEQAMTTRVADRFRLLRTDIGTIYDNHDLEQALNALDGLAHHVPLIGAMTTRNFDDIFELLQAGIRMEPGSGVNGRVVQRGLEKKAPFHRSRNSVADALLIELYLSATAKADLAENPHAFVTSNSNDFSLDNGDKRQPHKDLEHAFAHKGSIYALGFDGLDSTLQDHFGDELTGILDESDFVEDPRLLVEIQKWEQELFDRIWYQRKLNRIHELEDAEDSAGLAKYLKIAGDPMKRVEAQYGEALGPYSDFEWGMLHGKLSALRWVLGAEWDFLDT
ncbi:PIN domain-containing protein [Pseudarthrobacter sp. CC12]|uniref:PIN domain-containing protein n=1 Tax=Pseudarthrobacter sp. CC12 TaxID=3029193 RepID=UPI00326578AC